ncbi:hypothetical protein, partial [uncultured Faecalibaculum sp.]
SSGILFGQAKLLNVLNRRIRIRMYGGVRGRGSTNLFLSTRLLLIQPDRKNEAVVSEGLREFPAAERRSDQRRDAGKSLSDPAESLKKRENSQNVRENA